MKKSQALLKRSDLLLLLSVVTVAVLLFAVMLVTRTDGKKVTVKSNGETIGEYYLSQNQEIRLPSSSDEYNILVIEDGCAYIKDATCPDKLCIHQGRISETGQTLICLPNRLSVIISN